MLRILGSTALSFLLLAFLDTTGADSVSVSVANGETTVTVTGNGSSNDACPTAQYQVQASPLQSCFYVCSARKELSVRLARLSETKYDQSEQPGSY